MTDKRKAYEEKFTAQLEERNAQTVLPLAKQQELKAAGPGAQEDMKENAENIWDDVKATFHDAIALFK